MQYVAIFFSGALLCNAVPHAISGVCGNPFPTPFAKPRGVGDSSPVINFLWGFVNAMAGIYLLDRNVSILHTARDALAFGIGVLIMGIFLSVHFGNVRHASRGPANPR